MLKRSFPQITLIYTDPNVPICDISGEKIVLFPYNCLHPGVKGAYQKMFDLSPIISI
jgi:hypothetical protein